MTRGAGARRRRGSAVSPRPGGGRRAPASPRPGGRRRKAPAPRSRRAPPAGRPSRGPPSPTSASVSASVSREPGASSTRRTLCPARRPTPGHGLADGGGRPLGRDERDPERRAAGRVARDADLSAHPLGEALADGEPQARPAETPGRRRVHLAEALEKAVEPPLRECRFRCRARRSRPSASRPAVGCEDARRTISPQGVNFTAFERRFRRICRTRVTSPSSVAGTEGSMRKERSRPLAAAAGATRSKESSTASRREKGRLSSSSLSDSIFEKSRTSFRSVRRVSPLVRIVST